MEPYQYWTVAGFFFLMLESFGIKTFPLVLSGASFFGAVVAYRFPDLFLAQFITFAVFIPLLYMALKPYTDKKFGQGKNEHE